MGLEGSGRLRLLRFSDNQYMKAARLSAIHTSSIYCAGKIPAALFC
jgi:hypothetical protein